MIRPEEAIARLEGPIAIFGAGGFAGANLFHRLHEARTGEVFAITHRAQIPWRLNGTPDRQVLRCDIRSQSDVNTLFQKWGFKSVFVLSAYGGYARQTDPEMIYQTNLVGLSNVLTAAEKTGFNSLVSAGSSSEYGLNSAGASESHALLPNSHYAVSKVAASYLCDYMGKQRSLPVSHLRLFSLFGPWEESDRLLPQLISNALEGRYPQLVERSIARDFVYIDDAVDCLLLAATTGVAEARGQSLNVCSGKQTTLGELVDLVRETFKIEAVPQWGSMPNRVWDRRDWYGDPALTQKLLGWTASTTLKEGLVKTAHWLQSHRDRPKVFSSGSSDNPLRLTAIIACYRDAQAIPLMHERLTRVFQSLGVDYEIIFVNDCSPDNTDEVLDNLCRKDPHVISIEHSRNFGSQSAFMSGIQIATGDGIILMDGDLQDPPEEIPKLFEKWREGYDVVYGRRQKRVATWYMGLAYKCFYRLFRGLANIPIPLDAGDFSIISRKVARHMEELPETDQYLRGLRAWVGFKQCGVDYVRPDRAFGTSTNNWRKNLWWARKAIFSFSFAPLEFLLYLGSFFTVASLAAIAFQIIDKIRNPDIPRGVSTIILLVLLFGGANMLAISILGEYIAKVLEETKKRPKFIRSSLRYGGDRLSSREAIEQFIKTRLQTRGTT